MRRTLFSLVLAAAVALLVTEAWAQRAGRQPEAPVRGGQEFGPRFSPLIRAFDENNDGILTQAEIAKVSDKLRCLDKDNDGKLTAEELRELMPFGPPMGPAAGFRPPAAEASQIDNPQLPKDDQEKQILAVLEQMGQQRRYQSVPPTDGRLLRLLAEAVEAKRIVEVGMSVGYSTICFAMAARKTGGHVWTHEIDPERIRMARDNFQRAGVTDLITIIEGDAHEKVKQHTEPIDVVFLDADKEGYIDYLQKLLPLVRPGGLVIAHNMRTPRPDPRYLEAITQDSNLETMFLLMEGAGVGVTLKKR